MWHHFLLRALGTGDSGPAPQRGQLCLWSVLTSQCKAPRASLRQGQVRVPQVVRPHGLRTAPGWRGQGCWKMERLGLEEMFQEPLGSLVSWTRDGFPPLE